jgi:hypothetical protein
LKLRAGVEVAIVEPEAKEAGTPAQTAKAQ